MKSSLTKQKSYKIENSLLINPFQVQKNTNSKNAKQVSRQNEKKFRVVFNNAPIGMAINDLEGNILQVNRPLCKMLGYSKKELMRKSYLDLTALDDKQKNKKLRRELLEGKAKYFQIEKRYLHKSGRIVWGLLMASLVKDDKGNPQFFIGQVEDITQRKQTEAELQSAQQLSDSLNNINTVINSTLDFNKIMQRVVLSAAKAINCESSAVILRHEDQWMFKYVSGLKVKPGTIMDDNLIQCGVLASQTKQTVICNDAQNDPRFNPKIMKDFNIKSFLTIPLIVKNKFIGVLDFYYHSEITVFSNAQIDFARKLGQSISLALENARLYEQEHKIADKLQDALINVPSKIKGIDFGYLYRPATSAAKVGGDFYDLFTLHNNNVGIIIGDVSGKGIQAASLTALVKNTIKAYAYQGDSPGLAMTKTNNIVAKATSLSTFVTVIMAILDAKTGELTYCSAGHPQAIIKTEAGVKLLETSSPAIGVILNERFINNSTFLETEDLLVLYTDGVIDAKCTYKGERKGFYGEKRLLSTIKKSYATAKTIPQEIFQSIMYCPGCILPDDIVILAVSLEKTRSRSQKKASRLTTTDY